MAATPPDCEGARLRPCPDNGVRRSNLPSVNTFDDTATSLPMWIDAAEADLPEGARRLVRREGHEIALFRIAGTYYAIADGCPHAGGSLVLGKLDGTIVTCRAHGLRFDVRSGCQAGSSSGLKTRSYPVRVHDGRLEIELEPTA